MPPMTNSTRSGTFASAVSNNIQVMVKQKIDLALQQCPKYIALVGRRLERHPILIDTNGDEVEGL
jgi:hypothetical protein